MRVTFVQSGGFVGAVKGCVLDAEGLAPDERAELESLVAASGLAGSIEAFSSAGRDLREYDVVIEHEAAVRRLSCDERSVPESARPLVSFLATRARPQPPDFADAVRRRAADA